MWVVAALVFGVLGLVWGAGGARRAGEVVGRSGRRAVPGAWRPGVGVLAVLALVAALVLAVRAEWLPALIALAVALVTAAGVRRAPASVRRRRRSSRSRRSGERVGSRSSAGSSRRSEAPTGPRSGAMSRRDAAALLGVAEAATSEEVREAHMRLMRRLHPDLGGTAGLAAQLNLARAVLLGER